MEKLPDPKPVCFEGDSLARLREFPHEARQDAGYAIDQIQRGGRPADSKPFSDVGAGVEELRVWDEAGTYRIMYLARFAEGVYVLHCFKKTSQKTERKDIDLAAKRYADLVKRRKK